MEDEYNEYIDRELSAALDSLITNVKIAQIHFSFNDMDQYHNNMEYAIRDYVAARKIHKKNTGKKLSISCLNHYQMKESRCNPTKVSP